MECSAFSLLIHGVAILDFELEVTEVPLSFQVGVLTSGGVPDDVSNCELGSSDLLDQLESIIRTEMYGQSVK